MRSKHESVDGGRHEFHWLALSINIIVTFVSIDAVGSSFQLLMNETCQTTAVPRQRDGFLAILVVAAAVLFPLGCGGAGNHGKKAASAGPAATGLALRAESFG